MNCPKCGGKLGAGAKFCPDCGEKIEQVSPLPETSDVPNPAAAVDSKKAGKGAHLIMKVLIVLALICFFMPFVTVSCGDVKVEETGFDLMIGRSEYSGSYGSYLNEYSDEDDGIKINPCVLISGICGVVALFVGMKISGVLSVVSSILLIIFRFTAISFYEIETEYIDVKFNVGLYFTILFFAASFAFWLYWLNKNKSSSPGTQLNNN